MGFARSDLFWFWCGRLASFPVFYPQSKILDPVKGEIVCVVGIVGAAQVVVKGRPADKDDVVALELPVDILPGVPLGVGMVEQR